MACQEKLRVCILRFDLNHGAEAGARGINLSLEGKLQI